jgi:hypothetical protein
MNARATADRLDTSAAARFPTNSALQKGAHMIADP